MASMYCQPSDLSSVINTLALVDVSLVEQTKACQQASALLDDYAFRPRYGNNQPILLAWGPNVTLQAATIAVYLLLKARGYMPDAGGDSRIEGDYELAIDWAKGVGSQRVTPDVSPNVQMNQNQGPDLPQVRTSPQRGWTQSGPGGRAVIG